MSGPDIFGWHVSRDDVAAVARAIVAHPTHSGSARLFVTPNIQHVADQRRDPELRAVLEGADLLVCDGFPVALYALARGTAIPGRVTGREVTDAILHDPSLPSMHRPFFLVDGEETAQAVRQWANEAGVTSAIEVAPMGFGNDAAYCTALADRIRAAGTTLLFLCLGAPRSELFAWRHRDELGGCWALCVGQSVRMTLGLVRRPPALVERLNVEWLWRILLEPRRLIGRYARSSIGFLLAIAQDLRRKPR